MILGIDPRFDWVGKIKKKRKKKTARHWVHNTKLTNALAQKTHNWDGEKDRGRGHCRLIEIMSVEGAEMKDHLIPQGL